MNRRKLLKAGVALVAFPGAAAKMLMEPVKPADTLLGRPIVWVKGLEPGPGAISFTKFLQANFADEFTEP